MSFDLEAVTSSSEWQKKRAAQWKDMISSDAWCECTRKELKQFEHIFMTGLRPKGMEILAGDWLALYPAWNDDGLDYFFNTLLDVPLSDSDCHYIPHTLIHSAMDEACLSLDDASKLFDKVMGGIYKKEIRLLWKINGEEDYRTVLYEAEGIFNRGIKAINLFLKYKGEKVNVWVAKLNYLFSIIPYLDERVFYFHSKRERLPAGTRADWIQGLWLKVMNFSCTPPLDNRSPEEQLIIQKVCDEFFERMENLDTYPHRLKEVWDGVKAEHGR